MGMLCLGAILVELHVCYVSFAFWVMAPCAWNCRGVFANRDAYLSLLRMMKGDRLYSWCCFECRES